MDSSTGLTQADYLITLQIQDAVGSWLKRHRTLLAMLVRQCSQGRPVCTQIHYVPRNCPFYADWSWEPLHG
jgi:hypothetical protein